MVQWKYHSAVKKNDTMPSVAMWMDLEIIKLSEVRQKYAMRSLICGIEKERMQMNLCTKHRETHRASYGCFGRKDVGEGFNEGDLRMVCSLPLLLYLKQITTKGLLYNIRLLSSSHTAVLQGRS